MLLDDSALFAKLNELRNETPKAVMWTWTGSFIVDGEVHETVMVKNINIFSDFKNNHSDLFFIQVDLSANIYTNIILPNKHKLEFKLTREMTGISSNIDIPMDNYSQQFYAYLTDPINPFVQNTNLGTDNKQTDDIANLIPVTVQLVDYSLYETRLYEFAGSFRTVTIENLLKCLYTIPIKKNGNIPTNVEIIPPDNFKEYFQLVVPNGIRLVALADWIQNKYGVYATHIGCYLRNNFWYIYPLLNHQKFNDTSKTLTVITVPTAEMASSTSSYLYYEDSLVIFTTGGANHIDPSENVLNNDGRGIKYSIASNLIDGWRGWKDDIIPHISTNRNFQIINNETSPTQIENIRAIPGLVSNNPWKHISKVALGLASMVVVKWEFCNAQLLYPGMPVKVLYKHKGIVQSLAGTLISVQSTTLPFLDNPTNKQYGTTAELTIHAERPINENEPL